jgi:hypothetical protein
MVLSSGSSSPLLYRSPAVTEGSFGNMYNPEACFSGTLGENPLYDDDNVVFCSTLEVARNVVEVSIAKRKQKLLQQQREAIDTTPKTGS